VAATEDALLDCLEGRPPADLLHFAIHGRWDTSGFDDGLLMVDGTSIDPAVIRGTASGDARPAFVFLNACQVGAGESMLGDYAGTAAAFLHRGAPGVIAPLWSIDDAVAKDVALRFYERVFAGERPAEVLREERERFRATDGDEVSATSLAFQFFGHPAMRLEREHGADG
jgi:CHAT domain-containing protein